MLKYRLNLAISASSLLVQMENSYVTFKTAQASHAKPSVKLPPVTHSPLSSPGRFGHSSSMFLKTAIHNFL